MSKDSLDRGVATYSKPGQKCLCVGLAEFTGVGHVVEPNEIPDPVSVRLIGFRAVAPSAYDLPDYIPKSTRALRRVHCFGGPHTNCSSVQYNCGTKKRLKVIGGPEWSSRGNLAKE